MTSKEMLEQETGAITFTCSHSRDQERGIKGVLRVRQIQLIMRYDICVAVTISRMFFSVKAGLMLADGWRESLIVLLSFKLALVCRASSKASYLV